MNCMSKYKFVPLVTLLLSLAGIQAKAQLKTNTAVLQRASAVASQQEREAFQRLQVLAKQKGWPTVVTGKRGRKAILTGVDPKGYPMYTGTNDNIISAATIRTNLLWPGGSTGLNLSGSSANMKGKIAIWDEAKPRPTHVELTGRVTQIDNASSISDHSTHVAGTMIAAGVYAPAKGMAFAAQQLKAYDYNNHVSEMLAAASGLLVSNHSYGSISGWNFNSDQNRWEFWGNAGDTADYKFGYYSDDAQSWDNMAYNAPDYLIVKSAGNNRDVNGPAVGQPYWRYNSAGIMASAGNRPAGISNNDGYDIIPTYGVAKNILTVGAVNPISGGYTQASDVVIADFSSWGPTDDGRIKPDVVADGVNVLSSVGTSDNAYAAFSGTSMSSPAVTGSSFLLQEYYYRLHNTFMRSATLKGILIHTANEAGPSPGPDYQFGWGLIDMQKAAAMITSNNTDKLIYENNLTNGSSFTLPVIASGNGTLSATICWTDPAGTVDETNLLNNPAKKLVNDLDIRITSGANTWMPWVLNRSVPWNAATTGDDTLNNVEKIEINGAVPGQTYTIKITHKGTLSGGQQAYSLLVSGAGGQNYCTSTPASNTGTRIDSVNIGNVHNENPAGCTTYTNYTGLNAQIEPGQQLPFSIRLNSCDASTASRMVKIYIDYNNNGVFDTDELAAQSGVISGGNAVYSGTITTPGNLLVGNRTRMRIIASETTDPATITPCGTYGKGETEDYGVEVVKPSNDLALVQLIAPVSGDCSDSSQLIVVGIRNQGTVDKSNVPVTAVINGTPITETYPGAIPAGYLVTYTFHSPFIAAAGTVYNIKTYISSSGDQISTNDTLTNTIGIANKSGEPSGTAHLCGKKATLKVNDPIQGLNYVWYNSETGDSIIVASTDTTIIVNNPPADNTFYLSVGAKGSVGIKSKNDYPGGGGYQALAGNFMSYSASVPVTLKSARLFTGYPGKITFMVTDTVLVNGNIQYYLPPLTSVTVDVYATSPNPTDGNSSVNDPADTGAVFYINLPLPAGNHVILDTTVDASVDHTAVANATIFRNNNITGNPYPFTIPGLFSITGNSAYSATDPNNQQKFYYYTYDMKIQTQDCLSDRSPVVASVTPPPVISQTGDNLVSSSTAGNQWYYNDTLIQGATGSTYHPVATGVYTVHTTDSCELISEGFVFVNNNDAIGLTATPNPNHGVFNVSFYLQSASDYQIVLVNAVGQKCYTKEGSNQSGLVVQQLNAGSLATGVYVLGVRIGSKWYKKKLIITRQ